MGFSDLIDKGAVGLRSVMVYIAHYQRSRFSIVGPRVPLDWHDPVLTWGGATVVARIVSGHFGSNREHVRRV